MTCKIEIDDEAHFQLWAQFRAFANKMAEVALRNGPPGPVVTNGRPGEPCVVFCGGDTAGADGLAGGPPVAKA